MRAMVLLALLLLLVALPLAELYVIIQVGSAIGALPTIALLILTSVLGVWLMRSQGRLAWRRLRTAVAAGQPPAREVVDGALVLLGGALLFVPGFITDAVGAMLLLAPSRVLIRALVLRHAQGRLLIAALGGANAVRTRARARRDYDVDATATDFEPRHLHG